MLVTQEKIVEALRTCYDPEIPINIYDLGLVYGIAQEENKVKVTMTLTAKGCPAHTMISQDVKTKLLQVEGIKEADVEIVWDPPWTMERITEEGKKTLMKLQESMG